jgi:cell division protein FtsL
MDAKQIKQERLDRLYKVIVNLVVLIVAGAIIAIFVQIYNINVKIHDEVAQIQAAQQKNRGITNSQNNVVLSYLECITIIQPADRNAATVKTCVAEAEKTNPQAGLN